METFWCMTTEPAGAPIGAPTSSPTVTGMAHQPSAQARTPRLAQMPRELLELGAPHRRGMAPREWLTR